MSAVEQRAARARRRSERTGRRWQHWKAWISGSSAGLAASGPNDMSELAASLAAEMHLPLFSASVNTCESKEFNLNNLCKFMQIQS
jgi:hypothetical protein